MQQLLAAQYEEIKGARAALFNYCRSMAADDLQKRVAEFNNTSILNLLGHTANTYIHWLVQLDRSSPMNFYNDSVFESLNNVQAVYQQIDSLVKDFLTRYSADYTRQFTEPLPRSSKVITTSPLQLFTHVITHEFHHKGQILTMSRLLGYIPADTDVIRT